MDDAEQTHTKLPVKQAEALLRDRQRAVALAARAARKAEKNKRALRKIWTDLATLIRLISAWARRDYSVVPWSTILAASAALIYLINPFDLIPDFIQGFGLIDDVAVLGLVIGAIRDDLTSFAAWERQRSQPHTDSPAAQSVDTAKDDKRDRSV